MNLGRDDFVDFCAVLRRDARFRNNARVTFSATARGVMAAATTEDAAIFRLFPGDGGIEPAVTVTAVGLLEAARIVHDGHDPVRLAHDSLGWTLDCGGGNCVQIPSVRLNSESLARFQVADNGWVVDAPDVLARVKFDDPTTDGSVYVEAAEGAVRALLYRNGPISAEWRRGPCPFNAIVYAIPAEFFSLLGRKPVDGWKIRTGANPLFSARRGPVIVSAKLRKLCLPDPLSSRPAMPKDIVAICRVSGRELLRICDETTVEVSDAIRLFGRVPAIQRSILARGKRLVRRITNFHLYADLCRASSLYNVQVGKNGEVWFSDLTPSGPVYYRTSYQPGDVEVTDVQDSANASA